MKKLVAFVMILSLGLFCAVGCTSRTPEKQKQNDTTKQTDTSKPADTKAPEKPAADIPVK